MDDAVFLTQVTESLGKLPGVLCVALGGSRAQATNRPDSDWDVAVYYRGSFDPDEIRSLGWGGQLSDIGGWGPIFNGGGAAHLDGRVLDVHYRDLDLIDRIHSDAERGAFRIEPLLFHQAGIPTYILLAELAVNHTLVGDLPRWEFPVELRRAAPAVWWAGADLTLHYAKEGHARHGRIAQCAGLLSEAACRTGHAILAHRGEWITNEKKLLTRAGLQEMDSVIADLHKDPVAHADRARSLLEGALNEAGIAVAR